MQKIVTAVTVNQSDSGKSISALGNIFIKYNASRRSVEWHYGKVWNLR